MSSATHELEGRIATVTVAFAGVVGAVARLATVHYLSFRGDELATLKWSLLPTGELLRTYGQGATSHLHDLLMKAWIGAVGTAPLALKLPSLLAGVLTIPLVFMLGCRWLGRREGAVAAVLAALSVPLIMYARTARPYALLTAGVVVSMYLFVEATRAARRGWLLALTAVNALLLATSLNATYVLLVQGLAIPLTLRGGIAMRWRRALEIAASLGLSVLAAVAFYARALTPMIQTVRADAARHFRFSLLSDSFAGNHPSATSVMLFALVIGSVVAWRRGHIAARILVLWAVVPTLFYVLSRIAYPVAAVSRYLVPTLPAQFLLVALALVSMADIALRGRRVRRVAFPVVLCMATVAAFWNVDLWRPGARAAIFAEIEPSVPALHRVLEVARRGDVVTFDLESRFYWLFAAHGGADAQGAAALVGAPHLKEPGRLIVVTLARPQARRWWQEHFEIETIGDERFRTRLYLLVSEPLPAGSSVLNGPLRAFLRGYLEEMATGVAPDSWKASRQYLVAGQAHRLLARLEDAPAQRSAHLAQATEYQRRAAEVLRNTGGPAAAGEE